MSESHSPQFKRLNKLHESGEIELWLSRSLGNPKNNGFILALGKRRPNSVLKNIFDLARWAAETGLLVYVSLFSGLPWYVVFIPLALIIWYEMRKSKYDIQKLIIESALSEEEIFNALWRDGIVSIHSRSSGETHTQNPYLEADWRSLINEIEEKQS